MSLISRRNLTRSGALFACLPSFAFSQSNSPDIDSPIPRTQVKLLNDDVLKPTEIKKPSAVPVVTVQDKSALMVQHEKGQMFAEDVRPCRVGFKSLTNNS